MNPTTVGRTNDNIPGIYIGRPLQSTIPWGWGNPFSIRNYSREKCLLKFENWFLNSPNPRAQWMREHINELKGRHLKCFCLPLACHGAILKKYADLSKKIS